MGENPIQKTIKLKTSESSSSYLELKTDGTALFISEKEVVAETLCKYKYTYNADLKRIYMRVEKESYHNELFHSETEGQLLTYDEMVSKFNEELTTEKIRQSEKEWYEESKDDKWFKENYPDCDTYEKYEAAFLKKYGYDSYNDFVNSYKQSLKDSYKAYFGAQITYAYDTKDGKITLTEKFTGVKNLLDSECEFRSKTGYDNVSIDCYSAQRSIKEDDFYYFYYGTLDTDKKTIDFEKQKETRSDHGGKYETIGHVNATYTEDIDRGTVTINCEGKEFICEFEGQNYTQE